jgi:hypothetical protein
MQKSRGTAKHAERCRGIAGARVARLACDAGPKHNEAVPVTWRGGEAIMALSNVLRRAILAGLLATGMAPLPAAAAEPTAHARKPDLGDLLQGTWHGDVISDSKGSSRNDVTLILTRSGVNQVTITSDYPRLPVVTVRVERAMQSIIAADGDTAFSYDTTKQPPQLDVSFHNEVSWSGTKG